MSIGWIRVFICILLLGSLAQIPSLAAVAGQNAIHPIAQPFTDQAKTPTQAVVLHSWGNKAVSYGKKVSTGASPSAAGYHADDYIIVSLLIISTLILGLAGVSIVLFAKSTATPKTTPREVIESPSPRRKKLASRTDQLPQPH